MKQNLLTLVLILFGISGIAQAPLPSWALGPFVRPRPAKPVIIPDNQHSFLDPMSGKKVAWMSNAAFNPAAIVKDNKIVVLFRAEDVSGENKIGGHTSRIGVAESTNGIAMKIHPVPVLYPDHDGQQAIDWPGGSEDPRVAQTENGTYVLLYTSWNLKTPRLSVATSRDLIHWTKHGPAFKTAWEGRFANRPSKSASIVTKLVNDKQVIAKINGKYLMYWGEYFVNPAVSDDLINWTPLLDEKKNCSGSLPPGTVTSTATLQNAALRHCLPTKGFYWSTTAKTAPATRETLSMLHIVIAPGRYCLIKKIRLKCLGVWISPFCTRRSPLSDRDNMLRALFLLKDWFTIRANGFYTMVALIPEWGWQYLIQKESDYCSQIPWIFTDFSFPTIDSLIRAANKTTKLEALSSKIFK